MRARSSTSVCQYGALRAVRIDQPAADILRGVPCRPYVDAPRINVHSDDDFWCCRAAGKVASPGVGAGAGVMQAWAGAGAGAGTNASVDGVAVESATMGVAVVKARDGVLGLVPRLVPRLSGRRCAAGEAVDVTATGRVAFGAPSVADSSYPLTDGDLMS